MIQHVHPPSLPGTSSKVGIMNHCEKCFLPPLPQKRLGCSNAHDFHTYYCALLSDKWTAGKSSNNSAQIFGRNPQPSRSSPETSRKLLLLLFKGKNWRCFPWEQGEQSCVTKSTFIFVFLTSWAGENTSEGSALGLWGGNAAFRGGRINLLCAKPSQQLCLLIPQDVGAPTNSQGVSECSSWREIPDLQFLYCLPGP